ncbi:ROK family protein [Sphingomonas lacunae]|uniref:fructokinase n=1 Tax=Sphingomonas lacunae TaxID=2698828 RepID=A0A6M4AXW6_9SPHN|nr:ROK family protein [Sphingomonas lacunae]QJQ32879.1 ROK family protein [Sphingomonas lacunae]
MNTGRSDDRGRIAGLELGGTKAIVLLWQDGVIVDECRVPTRSPDVVFADILPLMQRWWDDGPFDAVGIGSFGPVAVDPASQRYGHILTTPKPGWGGAAVLPALRDAFACPIAIDTDVNAAAMAEYRWGAGQGATSLLYLTIGTGLGGGALVNGMPIHGRLHPEMGHMPLRRQPGDEFAGACPFHADCAEGLLSGPALAARFGAPADAVAAGDPRWDVPVADLAQLLVTLIHGFAPNRILVGGGVGMGAGAMLDRARDRLPALLGGYYPDLDDRALAQMISQPALGERAGPLGAIAVGLSTLI